GVPRGFIVDAVQDSGLGEDAIEIVAVEEGSERVDALGAQEDVEVVPDELGVVADGGKGDFAEREIQSSHGSWRISRPPRQVVGSGAGEGQVSEESLAVVLALAFV